MEEASPANTLSPYERLLFQLMLGLVSGLLFGTYEYFFRRTFEKKISFGKLLFLGAIGYGLVIHLFILVTFVVYGQLFDGPVDERVLKKFFDSGSALVVVVYCFLVGFLSDFVMEMDKKFGPGNLIKMLRGEFYVPKQEERIFMFLDMRSSTTIAEQLGHIKYSQLVQDCFRDIDVVMNYGSEIYQYVGDEAVLTWEREKGIRDANCVYAFFAFIDRLQSRSEYYLDRYGVLPEFKAGLNLGEVTVAEVGEIKREIAYHGDTLNTAARIQSKCNEYGQDILLSEILLKTLPSRETLQENVEGAVILRGKTEQVKIYSLQRRH